MPGRNAQRLAEIIRQRAAHMILHELKDPRLGFLTVTHVKLSPDLSSCRIYYSVLGSPADRNKVRHALEDARGYLQGRIGKSLRTRVIPHLTFEYDESIEGAIRLRDKLRELVPEPADAGDDDEQPASPQDSTVAGA